MIDNIEKWLNQEPDEKDIAPSPSGGRHIPIAILKNLLDEVYFETKDYHFELYKNGQDLCVAASIVLEINYLLDLPHRKRSFVGACNFSLKLISPIEDWNATAKSMCIKNAALDAAKRFGRHLNDDLKEVLPAPKVNEENNKNKQKPDSRIMKQFNQAVFDNDQAAISLLKNMYEIEP